MSYDRIGFSLKDYNNCLDYLSGRSYDTILVRPWYNKTQLRGGKLYLDNYEIIPQENRDEVLKELYKNPLTTGNRDRLFNYSKQKYLGISRRYIMEWLRNQEAWQLKARLLRHRITKSIVVNNPNIHWQTDLVDFQKYKDKNDDYRYVMTVVDLFSKYAYAKPLRDKEGKTVAKAMKEILEANKNPKVIQADNGSEFIS